MERPSRRVDYLSTGGGICWGILDVNRADQFRQRQSWHAQTAIFRTVVPPAAVLALLERSEESPPEVVVDPQMLTGIEQVSALHPQRYREGERRYRPATDTAERRQCKLRECKDRVAGLTDGEATKAPDRRLGAGGNCVWCAANRPA
jgi:hypothetical protein